MHIIESYAADSRLKIDKPFIYQKYFPLTFGDFITLNSDDKSAGRDYKFWSTVTPLLSPYLTKRNISIVQIGTKDDSLIKGCIDLRGRGTINQTSYIIDNALLHLGVESGFTQLASGLAKKIVTIFPLGRKPCATGPYWSDPSKVVNITPDDENINSITPESIVKAVCNLLNIEFDYGYETLFIGSAYDKAIIEHVPDTTINVTGFSGRTIFERMDLEHSEECLDKQLGVDCGCDYSIITERPIDMKILKKHKDKIKALFYRFSKNHSVSFVNDLLKTGINYVLCSRESKEFVQSVKINYMDHGLIHRDEIVNPKELEKLKNEDLENLYFSSNKFIISNQKFYPNVSYWKENKNVPKIDTCSVFKLLNVDSFWWDTDHVRILKKA
jgi:hypothetical protein